MAKYVTIGVCAPRPPMFTEGRKVHGQEAVDKMIAFWRSELSAVTPERPDIVVVPEACDRFPEYSNEERLAYYGVRKNQVRDFFGAYAKEHECYVAYSAARAIEDGTWRNSTQIMDRTGKVIGIYNKNHVVIEETTEYGILCGKDAPVFECDFGTVACAICFDLNFDEIRLKYAQSQPDLLLFSSMYHGGLMQSYWAYSCRTHFVGAVAGQPGTIISPVGEVLFESTNYFDFVVGRVNLDCRVVHLDYNWGKLRAMREKYGPKVRVQDPGRLGAVLISSETDEFTIGDMIREFDIEIWDTYMARALAHRNNPANREP